MSEPTRKYRGSEAPLAMLCAGSVNAPEDEILIDSVNPAGTVGTVVHSLCESFVTYGRFPTDWEGISEAWGMDKGQIKEIGSLAFAVKAFWDANKEAFPNAQTEIELTYDVMSGHVDVISMAGDTATILDWKSTRLDVDYTNQMLFYAWLVMLNHPDVYTFKTVLVFLRDRTANIKEWTKEQILGFEARYTQQVLNWDGRTYRPGGHCSYCKRFIGCPARGAMVQKTIQELSPDEVGSGNIVDFYKRLQTVEVLTKKAREQVRAAVEQAGGELLGLKLVPSSRDTIDAQKAWPVIVQNLEPDDFAPAVTINKGALMEAVAKASPRGRKKEAKARIMEALIDAGAVATTEFKTLRVIQNNDKEVQIAGTSETE